jgi:hypothetical protein
MRELRPALGRETAAILQVVRGVGFRLNLPESRIHLARS